jgi:hypothetical protein
MISPRNSPGSNSTPDWSFLEHNNAGVQIKMVMMQVHAVMQVLQPGLSGAG